MAGVSPLAPERFPELPPIAGVRLAAYAAGVRYQGRNDLMLAELAPGSTIAGVLTQEEVPLPSGKLGVWDPTTIHYLLHNPIYWGEPVALKKRNVPVDKAVRHLYRRRMRDVPRPAEERVALPSTIAPTLVSKELAERVHARLRTNQQLAPRNNRQPLASLLRGLAYCGVCGTRMTLVNGNRTLAGPQFRCTTGMRLLNQRDEKCRAGGNTIMAAKLDAAAWAEMIRLFETPGALDAELQAARNVSSAQHAIADEPARDLAHKIADAERRLASLRTMAELVEAPDQQEALAARITLLARDRDVWVKELAGHAAQVERLRSRQEAILAFQQHVAAEHGSMEAWAGHLMRQLMLILDARVEVWPQRDVQAGTAPDRGVLRLNLPLSGERRAALSRLLRDEHVLTAVPGAEAEATPGANAADCGDRTLARSTMKM